MYSCFSGKLYEYRLPREWTWYREGHEDKMFREKKAKGTFQAGLQYLPFFLAEAMADEDLITYLRTNNLDMIRAKELPRLAWAEDKTRLEKAVEDYLAVCTCLLSLAFPELIYLNRDGTRKWTLYMITLRSFSSACDSFHIFYFRQHLTLLKLLTPRGSSVAEPCKLWLRPFKCVSAIPVEIPLHHMVFGACHDLYHRGTELRLLCCTFSSPRR